MCNIKKKQLNLKKNKGELFMRRWIYKKLRYRGYTKSRAYNVSLFLETIIGGVAFFASTIIFLIMIILIFG